MTDSIQFTGTREEFLAKAREMMTEEDGMFLSSEQVRVIDKLDSALCQYLNNVDDEWTDERWKESVRRNFGELAVAYNDCHVAKIMELREARAALQTPHKAKTP